MSIRARSQWLDVDIRPIHEIARLVRQLGEEGWRISEDAGTVRLEIEGVGDVVAQVAKIESLGVSVLTARIWTEIEGSVLEIRNVGQSFGVTILPEVELEALFGEVGKAELAGRVRNRDLDAALQIPLPWNIVLDIRLDNAIRTRDLDVRVSLQSKSIEEEFLRAVPGTIGHLIPDKGKRLLRLALDAPDERLHLGAVSFAGGGFDGGESTLVEHISLPPLLGHLEGDATEESRDGILNVVPSELFVLSDSDVGSFWDLIRLRCEVLAALLTWAAIASDVIIEDNSVIVDFRGLKRVRFQLPQPADYVSDNVLATRELYEWVFYDRSPDRLLAARQVVSLYSGAEAVNFPGDILDSAEVVYSGLRSDSVVEALRNVREAESRALDTVRDSLNSVQLLAKNASERLLATLVAVGGVVVADETQSVSVHTGRILMWIVVAFLAFLLCVAVFVEGPLLSMPLKTMGGDFDNALTPMTENQQKRIASLPSVEATRKKIVILRVFIPVVYVIAIALIVVFAFPGRGAF